MLSQEKWNSYSFYVQMGNIASEISRAVRFEKEKKFDRVRSSLYRVIELIDLTIDAQNQKGRFRELCRFRELVCDWYTGSRLYKYNPESLLRYALEFGRLARKP